MNEQSQKILTDLLQRAVSGVDAAVSFSQAQIPDVIKQLLAWKFVVSLLFFITFILLLILMAFVAFRVFRGYDSWVSDKKSKARDCFDRRESWTRYSRSGSDLTSNQYDRIMSIPDTPILAYIIVGVSSFFFLLIALSNLAWLKILLAPKLYLIEYAASLVK